MSESEVEREAVERGEREAGEREAVEQEAVEREAVGREAGEREAVGREAVEQEAVEWEAVERVAVGREAVEQEAVERVAAEPSGPRSRNERGAGRMTERGEMEAALEAILFVVSEPVPRQKLLELFDEDEREQAAEALAAVLARYAGAEARGVMAEEVAGG